MRIKTYKLFLESLSGSLYKDDEYILHGLFTPLYDKYYDIILEKGWIDDNDEFRILSPGKNRRIGYKVMLLREHKTEEFTREDIQDCISNIEFDDMKVIKQTSTSPPSFTPSFIIDALKTSDITVDDVVKELDFISKEEYLEADAFIKGLLSDAKEGVFEGCPEWRDKNGELLISYDPKIKYAFLDYDKIWLFFKGFWLEYEQIQEFTRIIMDNNLDLPVEQTDAVEDWED